MGKVYVDTGGSANNSGSRDDASAHRSGTAATVSGSVVTLDGSPDLSTIVTSGANQDSIHLNQATNTNRKIFWITAFDNVAKTVTVDVAPTGVTSSAWAIGGRHVWTKASIEGAMRAADEIIFNNSPASDSGTVLTARVSATTADGMPKVRGATGVRPVLTCTGNAFTVNVGASSDGWRFENLEIANTAAAGGGMSPGLAWIIYNIKVSDSGSFAGISMSAAATKIIGCEVGNVSAAGIDYSFGNKCLIYANYIHDCGGDGITLGNNSQVTILFNIVDSCAGRGIYANDTIASVIENLKHIAHNTVYGCGNSGLEVVDADIVMVLMNNIFSENGNAAGEYNVEWTAGDAEKLGFHAWNVFHHSGGGGGANLSGLTVNAHVPNSEFTTDPLFVDAAGGNFAIGTGSPAKATGYPGQFLG